MRVISEGLRGLRAGAAPGLLAVVAALAVVLPAPGATAAPKPPPAPTSDRVKAWGDNAVGQLGDGTSGAGAERHTPVAVAGLTEAGVRAVSAGVEGRHTLAVLRNGGVEAWGNNDWGQLGDGRCGTGPCTLFNATPGTVAGLDDVVAVAAGKEHSLALRKGGTVLAWGHNNHGQLGCSGVLCSAVDHQSTPVAVTFPTGTAPVVAIAAGSEHSLALLSTGAVWAWGNNLNGRLGIGTTAGDFNTPQPVPSLTTGVIAIAAGDSHSLALRSNGSVMAWGNNNHGQLGAATPTETGTPQPVTGLPPVKAIAAGANHSLAVLRSNGSVMAWGNNQKGQLGCTTATVCLFPVDEPTPHPVVGLTGVKAIAAGDSHSLALLSNSAVKAWGNDDKGQLGLGFHFPCGCQPTPVSVKTGLTSKTTLTAGEKYSLAG